MYLRFATTRIDEDSRKPQGVFVAAYLLLDSGELTSDEWKRAREILDWFNKHLPHPPKVFLQVERFSGSSRAPKRASSRFGNLSSYCDTTAITSKSRNADDWRIFAFRTTFKSPLTLRTWTEE
jgi:hypothetical protein